MFPGNAIASLTSIDAATASSSMRGLGSDGNFRRVGVDQPDLDIERRAKRVVERNRSELSTLVLEQPAVSPVVSRKRKLFTPSAPLMDSAVQQVWEGTVIEVDDAQQLMRVMLRSKRLEMEDHAGEIDLTEVMPQDRNLVRPGAVFYLTLCRNRLPKGTFQNAQELRFRRVYSWTQQQLAKVEALADELSRRVKTKPRAE